MSFEVDDRVIVSCTCGKPRCFSPASAPKQGTIYDVPYRGKVYVDFWSLHGPNPNDADDSRCYEFPVKCVKHVS
jgi:hypothetical protein